MSSPLSTRIAAACLATVTLLAGPVACSPSVSDMDLRAAQNKAEEANKEVFKAEAEIKVVREEMKGLKGKGLEGAGFEQRMKRAESLREEKASLETIKTDVEAKTAHFNAEAKRHRDALASESKP